QNISIILSECYLILASSNISWNLSLSNSSTENVLSKPSKELSVSSSPCASGPGMIVILTFASFAGARRRTICVAKRVQRSLEMGNDSPVMPSRTDDFPLDWSPTTTSLDGISNASVVPIASTYLRQGNILANTITQPLNAALEKLQERQEKGIQLRDRDPDEPPSWGRESPQMTPTPSPSPSPAYQTLATPPYPTPLSLSPSNSATAGTKRKRGDDHGAEDEPPRTLRARIADLADEETHGVSAMKGQQSANSEEQTSPTSGVSKSNASSTSNAVPVKSRAEQCMGYRVPVAAHSGTTKEVSRRPELSGSELVD
ncbi:hypothetical protein EJ02DRAFT_477159, partial [Clathrospora elynae]